MSGMETDELMDAVLTQPTPLTEDVRIAEISQGEEGLEVLAHVIVDPDNPILAGHYPGMPIFPGVCLIECAHRTVLLAMVSSGHTPVLEAVLSARFKAAVYPKDLVSIRARMTSDERTLNVTATLHSRQLLAAKVALLYGLAEGAACTA
jgi:3-hydroxyacyl-[acyl-carrier-protein] dehydratase